MAPASSPATSTSIVPTASRTFFRRRRPLGSGNARTVAPEALSSFAGFGEAWSGMLRDAVMTSPLAVPPGVPEYFGLFSALFPEPASGRLFRPAGAYVGRRELGTECLHNPGTVGCDIA